MDWKSAAGQLAEQGYALLDDALALDRCRDLRQSFDRGELFRSAIVMEKHGFGKGEYKYFRYPLPPPVASLRDEAYRALVPVANDWNAMLKKRERFPASQQEFLEICSEADQTRPTALILRYRAGDYNCLHEDVYGEVAFPLQMTVFLSDPEEYEGGEFVLVEQRPRRQSRPIVLRPRQGQAVVIPNRYRPVEGRSGYYRTTFRHGVSEVRSGERFTLGVIFHDAR